MKIRGCHSIFSVGLLGHDTSFLNICNSVSIVREIDMAICGSSDLVQNCGCGGSLLYRNHTYDKRTK